MNRKELVKKWSEVDSKLSISDIKDSYVKENMAVLLENQETKNLKNEMIGESDTFTNVTPTSQATGQFKPIALALVRRTFPALFANKVVGVQAMNGPVGLAYALRFTYNITGVTTNVDAAFNDVNRYTGYTGSTPQASGAADVGTAAAVATAEAFQLNPGTGNMPDLKLKMTSTSITALTRKLAASFSVETAQDIKAMHGVDIEKEMLNVLQYEVLAEIDRELVAKLKTVAVDTDKGGEAVTSVDVSASDGRWSQERMTHVTNVIMKKSNDIATSTRRGAGNFVIVSPRVATCLQSSGKQFTANKNTVDPTNTMTDVGTINNVITVYRDSYASSDYALVGYKGPGISDAGVIYSPYITGLVQRAIAEEDFSPRIGVMSRYGITDSLLGSGRYYRYITFSNLDAVLGA